MQIPTRLSRRRTSISGHQVLTECLSPGHNSCKDNTDTREKSSGQKPVTSVGRFVAMNFFGCLAPPETANSIQRSVHSKEYKASQAVLDGSSRGGSQRGAGSSRGWNTSSHNSIHGEDRKIVKFTMEDIFEATRNFSSSLMIGRGVVGNVYKARLQDGTLVAVKRTKKSSFEKRLGVEFQSEIETLSQVEHLNLVKFYGYLEQKDERILVVEYVQNGTLREHLDCIRGNILDFASRLDIAIDVAHAITYLHMYIDHPIIHRDIKSSNILLTENLRAKVADFGFSRQAPDVVSGISHVSTLVKGTAGYLDPEYLITCQLTEKSDVYSFGVLLVELVTGRRAIEPKLELGERVTPKWAMKKFTEGGGISVLDPRLKITEANSMAIKKILELALRCLAPRRQNRPNMKNCGEILWIIRKDYRNILASDLSSFSSSSRRSTSVKQLGS